MAESATQLGTRRVLSDAKFMYVTPWADENTAPTSSSTVYDITQIVADTISIEQEDNNVNAKESEFTDVPLFENIDLGKFNFAATCIDTQNTILEKIYGWTTDTGNAAYAPKSYSPKYATILVGFANSVVVCPKVRLDNSIVIGTLKTGSAESQIGGTLYNAFVKATSSSTAVETPLAVIPVASSSSPEETALGVSVTATAPTTAGED